jgi:drug/metabolite transporter (DMT)-like permease
MNSFSILRSPSTVWSAAFYIVAAFLFVAVMSALGKGTPDIPTSTLVFFQSFVALLVFSPWLLKSGLRSFKTKHVFFHFVRAGSGLLSQVLMFLAVRKMVLVHAVLLSNSAPLFIPFLSWIWLKQSVRGIVWLSLALGLVGIILILKPGSDIFFSDPGAVGLALGSAFFSALALLSVNELSKTESSETILFYYFSISSILTAPFLFFKTELPSVHDGVNLLGVGLAMALAQFLIILAYRHANASRLAPLNYSVVIFSGLIGWILWDQVPDMISLLGVVLVTLGGILSARYGGVKSQTVRSKGKSYAS